MTRRAARSLPARAAAVGTIAALTALLASCGSDPDERSEGAYCASVATHLGQLDATAFTADSDVSGALAAWREVSSHAPAAVQREWAAMTGVLATAATVDAAVEAELQTVADLARLHEPDATRIIEYTYALCQLAIGGVVPTTVEVTLPPGVTAPETSAPAATETTVATTATTTPP
ncbi:MAG: hypothetical protein RLZ04_1755 [Actinomycetota bacterium]